jgi:hypothetical protein
MPKVKALNNKGELTWCTAKTPGSGNCNHVLHQLDGMTDEQFQQEVDNYNETLQKAKDLLKDVGTTYTKEDIEILENEGLVEIYYATRGNKEMFKDAANNIIENGDSVIVADSKTELDKKLYSIYFDKIKSDITDKLDRGEYSDYGSVDTESEDRDNPEYTEYSIDFTYHDMDDLTTDNTVEVLDINFDRVNGKYYAVNVSDE